MSKVARITAEELHHLKQVGLYTCLHYHAVTYTYIHSHAVTHSKNAIQTFLTSCTEGEKINMLRTNVSELCLYVLFLFNDNEQ